MIFYNGCSFTAGTELKNPEEHRYSRLVSTHYNTDEVNISESGRCNDVILRTTIEWFTKNGNCDLAIIQFSEWDRVEWVGKNGHRWNIGNGTCNKKANSEFRQELLTEPSESYYKYYHSPTTSADNFYRNWYLMKLFLESINQKYLFIQMGGLRGSKMCKDVKSAWNFVDFENPPAILDMLPFIERKYFCGTHPSEIGHQVIARHIILRR